MCVCVRVFSHTLEYFAWVCLCCALRVYTQNTHPQSHSRAGHSNPVSPSQYLHIICSGITALRFRHATVAVLCRAACVFVFGERVEFICAWMCPSHARPCVFSIYKYEYKFNGVPTEYAISLQPCERFRCDFGLVGRRWTLDRTQIALDRPAEG